MKNPFENVPLNTKRQYVMATTQDGCEIYMPVNTTIETFQRRAKAELQEYLNAQYAPPAPDAA